MLSPFTRRAGLLPAVVLGLAFAARADEPTDPGAPQRLYVLDIAEARKAHEGGDLARLRELLARHRPRPGQADLRGWEWHYLDGLARGTLLTARAHAQSVAALAFSLDGKRLASAGQDLQIKVHDAGTGREVAALRTSLPVSSLTWEEGGGAVLSVAADGAELLAQRWDPASGKELLAVRMKRNEVHSCAWAPDGKRLAAGRADGSLRVWDAATGKDAFVVRWQGRIAALLWQPGGQRLLTMREEGVVKVVDCALAKPVATLALPAPFRLGDLALGWSPDGKHVRAATAGGQVLAHDPATGRGRLWGAGFLRNPGGWVFRPGGCALSPDGGRLASVDRGDAVAVWDVGTGQLAQRLPPVKAGSSVTALTWSPDGKRLAAGSHDGNLKVWDVTAYRPADGAEVSKGAGDLPVKSGEEGTDARVLAWGPDGKHLAVGSGSGRLRVWAGEKLLLSRQAARQAVTALAWAPGGKELAVAAGETAVMVWDLEGKRLFSADRPFPDPSPYLAWSPTRRWLACRTARRAHVWDVSSGTMLLDMWNRTNAFVHLTWSPDGTQVAVLDTGGIVRVHDLVKETELYRVAASRTADATSWASRSLVWSADGKEMLCCTPAGVLVAREAATGKEMRSLTLAMKAARPEDRFVQFSFSPDGKWLATCSQLGAARVWDTATGKEVVLSAFQSGWFLWSPDSKRLLLGSPTRARVWDAAGWKHRCALDGVDGVTSANGWSLCPAGRQIAAACRDGTVQLWDQATERPLGVLGEPTRPRQATLGQVFATAWSADKKLLATLSRDGGLDVHDAVQGVQTLSLVQPSAAATAWAWSKDGRRLAVGDVGKHIRVWDPASGQTVMELPGHSMKAGTLAFSDDARWLLGHGEGVAGPEVAVWDLKAGKRAFALTKHRPLAAALSPDGRSVAVAGVLPGAKQNTEYALTVRHVAGNEETFRGVLDVEQLWGARRSGSPSLSWSPAGRLLLAVFPDGDWKVWDVPGNKELLSAPAAFVRQAKAGSALPASWSPDGKRIVAATTDGAVTVWDVRAGKEVLGLNAGGFLRVPPVWDPEGRRLATAVYPPFKDGGRVPLQVRVWDAATGKGTRSVTAVADGVPPWLEWTADGKWLLVGSRAWELASEKLTPLPPPGPGPLRKWRPGGTEFIAEGPNHTLRLWDVPSGKETARLGGPSLPPGKAELAWSPDDRLLAAAAGEVVHVWDARTGKPLGSFPAPLGDDAALAWGPGGKRLAVSGGGAVKVWDLAAKKDVHTLSYSYVREATSPPPRKSRLAWDVRNDRLAVGDSDGGITVWDATGKPVVTLGKHPAPVLSIAWSPDGRRLVSFAQSRDGNQPGIKVWDPGTGLELLEVPVNRSALGGVSGVLSWSADGWKLFLHNRVWDATPPG